MNWTTMRSGLVAAALLAATGVSAQTTNAWVPTSGNADWNTASNWEPAAVPDASDAWAFFTNANYIVGLTNTLSSDVTLNGLYFDDGGAGDAQLLRIAGRQITFAGTSPTIVNSNDFSGQIHMASTVRVDSVVLTLTGKGGNNNQLQGPLVGNGTFFLTRGNWEFMGMNSNFTGSIIVSNITGADAYVDGRAGSAFTQYWQYGDTNGATYIYREAFVRPMRDGSGSSNAEPFELYGVNAQGSVRFFANTNSRYLGVVTAHTNATINIQQYEGVPTALQRRTDFFYNGTLQDDGGSRNVHFLEDTAGSGTATGTLTRMSQLVFGGTGTYGGFTHISNTKDPDLTGTFDMYLQLTNGNNRLPVGTTMFLGGQTNDQGIVIGKVGSSGILILAGANQEFAGLYALGTGKQNRVVGGVPTNTTLTLNIATGTTNRYSGYLGGDPIVAIASFTNAGGQFFVTNSFGNQNNLSLVKKGDGLLNLTASSNTYAGTTKIEAGTLQINADQRSGGLITVDAGATLGGTGMVGAITSSGTVAPGNSVGTLTSYGNVTLGAGATLLIEINEFLGDDYDKLVLAGGAGNNVLNLTGSPNLTINQNYTPGIGDAFTIISGFADFDPGFDGTFSGKPDGGTFDVSGTTLKIDYN
ncbi:MAG: autotransporter-associated beta strand repeat-containing protein, partial [Verrucomicrobia bacterium]|nr:autotransporter-associated beta strand repeat-containing protein [Verrucomicrobiota bacterium]